VHPLDLVESYEQAYHRAIAVLIDNNQSTHQQDNRDLRGQQSRRDWRQKSQSTEQGSRHDPTGAKRPSVPALAGVNQPR